MQCITHQRQPIKLDAWPIARGGDSWKIGWDQSFRPTVSMRISLTLQNIRISLVEENPVRWSELADARGYKICCKTTGIKWTGKRPNQMMALRRVCLDGFLLFFFLILLLFLVEERWWAINQSAQCPSIMLCCTYAVGGFPFWQSRLPGFC